MSTASGKVEKTRLKSNISLYHQAVKELIRLKVQRNMTKSLNSMKFSQLNPFEWGNLLRQSISSRHYEVAQWIKSVKNPDIDTSNWFDEFETVIKDYQYDLIIFILENGLTIERFENRENIQDGYILKCAINSSNAIVQYLVENGARPSKNGSIREWLEILRNDSSFSYSFEKRMFIYRMIWHYERRIVDRSAYKLHNEDCPITHEPLSSFEEIGICESCENGFSAEALKTWLNQSNKCPLCKYYQLPYSYDINFVFTK